MKKNYNQAVAWDFYFWDAYGQWIMPGTPLTHQYYEYSNKNGKFVTYKLVGFWEMAIITWNRFLWAVFGVYKYQVRSEDKFNYSGGIKNGRYIRKFNSLPSTKKRVIFKRLNAEMKRRYPK